MKKEKSCGAIIVKDGKVLVIHQTNNVWCFPKGHVENDETEVETALREVKEETNLDIKIDASKRYSITYLVKDDILKEAVYFMAKPVGNIDIIKQDKEISEAYFESVDKVIDVLSHDNLKEMWKQVIKENNL